MLKVKSSSPSTCPSLKCERSHRPYLYVCPFIASHQSPLTADDGISDKKVDCYLISTPHFPLAQQRYLSEVWRTTAILMTAKKQAAWMDRWCQAGRGKDTHEIAVMLSGTRNGRTVGHDTAVSSGQANLAATIRLVLRTARANRYGWGLTCRHKSFCIPAEASSFTPKVPAVFKMCCLVSC